MDNQMEWLDSVEWHWLIACLMNRPLEVLALCFQLHAAVELLEISR